MESFLSSSNVNVSDDGDMMLKKVFANPMGLDIVDRPDWIQPKIGDKVEIVSWDTQCHVQECVRVAKLPYLTVKDVNPVCVGTGNDGYAWAYDICVEETELEFLQWHYRILK
jgi:hypothetical protein